MTYENALHKDAERGAKAEALLRSELLAEAFDRMRADYLTAWEGTAARDTDARERLWQAYQIVGLVRGHLQSVANNGKLARKEIDDIARMGERKKILGVY